MIPSITDNTAHSPRLRKQVDRLKRLCLIYLFFALFLSGCRAEIDYAAILRGDAAYTDAVTEETCTLPAILHEEIGKSLLRFSVIDLDGDGTMETVVWIGRRGEEANRFLLLYTIDGTIYGCNQTYRAMSNLKADGSFTWSGGLVQHGIGRWQLTPQGAVLVKTALVEKGNTDSPIFRIAGEAVSMEAYNAHITAHTEKPEAVWHPFTAETIESVVSN